MASRTTKVFALSLGKSLTGLVMLATAMVLARVLTKHDFATVQQTLLAYQFIAPLLLLGLPEAAFYFLPGETKRPRGVLIDNLTLLVALSCMFSLFLALGGNELLAMRFDNPDLARTLKWMIPYPLFIMPVALLGGVMVVRERVTAFCVYNVCTKTVLGGAIIAAAMWTHSYTGPLLAHILVPALILPVGLWMAFSSVPGDWTWPNWASMKEMLKFSVPLGMATMFGTMSMQLDKVIVSAMTSPEEFAVYANGAVEIPLIGIITGSVAAVVLADMRKNVINGEYHEAVRLFRLTAEKTSYILFPVMFFLLISGDSFIQTLFSEKYAQSVVPFRWYLLLLPVRTVVFGSLLMTMNKTRVILFRSVISLIVNAILSMILGVLL
jgi:O-antigen/teichoic acid export membrane protein